MPAAGSDAADHRSWLRSRRVPFATRTLLHDRLRVLISIIGIGFAILLVLLLRGIMDGTVIKSTTYIDHIGADVVVAREGVTNMALSSSVITDDVVVQVEAVPGVQTAAGIIRLPAIVSAGGAKRPATLTGYDISKQLGGPWKLTDGANVSADDEAVVDKVLADSLGLGVGGTIEISGSDFTIVGLSGETASIAGKHVFVSDEAAGALLGAPELLNFVLVVSDGTPADELALRIDDAVPGVSTTPRRELSSNDRDMLRDLFIAPINVMATVGFLVGLGIIGLTMYTTTAERLRDFGVRKAIGAPTAYLLRTVIAQALALGVAGFLVGLLAAIVAGPMIVGVVPDIGIKVNLGPALLTLAAVLVMSLIGAIIPVARIARVDPLVVFRR
jgi:putative ABC transport system permease protein